MSIFRKLFGGGTAPAKKTLPQKSAPPPGRAMQTLDTSLIVEPFAKINYWDLPDGGKRLRVYLLMESPIEGAQTGVAIDGSGSMMANYGKEAIQPLRPLNDDDVRALMRQGLISPQGVNLQDKRVLDFLVQRGFVRIVPPGENIVESQARNMTAYLSKFDADGGTTVIYWATGDGRQIEVVGDLTAAQCPAATFPGPQQFGQETHLLPAIRYFVDRFTDAQWGIYIFITDGALHDLDAVKQYCVQLARDISQGRRNGVKFVLIGVGDQIDEDQMEQLDDLETGTDVDLWDHKIAQTMQHLAEVFTEVVDEKTIVAPQGMVLDPAGNVIKDFRDTGVPALMEFTLPAGADAFILQIGENAVVQPVV